MDKEQIKALALQAGFKLKEQGNGTLDLNPYVYQFANDLIETVRAGKLVFTPGEKNKCHYYPTMAHR